MTNPCFQITCDHQPLFSDHLKERVHEACACPIPCSFLIFDPALSFATTSVFASERLLAATSRTTDLQTKYLVALETTQRMERIKFRRFAGLEREAGRRLHALWAVMRNDVRRAVLLTESVLQRVSAATRAVWSRKQRLYRWQAYHVQKNFVRARDAMEERTFAYLAAGFQEFATRTESRVLALAAANVTSPAVRTAIHALLATTLAAKMDLCDRALANYTQLYAAYYNGTPVFRYKFLSEPRADNVHVTPRPLLRHALFHSDYARKYSARVGEDIQQFKAAVAGFAELAASAYANGTLDADAVHRADVLFLWRGRRYLHSKSTFDYESIEFPLRELQNRMTSFERMWRNYEAIVEESLGNVESLKVSLDSLESSILKSLNFRIQMAREYVARGNVTKLDIAKELTSQNIYIGVSDLKVFFQSLRSRGQSIYDNWDKIAEATNNIWQAVIEDDDMVDYYLYKNLTDFLRNVSAVAMETTAEYADYRQRYDLRFLVGSADSLFLKSLAHLVTHLQLYLHTSRLGPDFIRSVAACGACPPAQLSLPAGTALSTRWHTSLSARRHSSIYPLAYLSICPPSYLSIYPHG